MITAGIDVGAENTKAVILSGNRIVAHSVVTQGMETALRTAQLALAEAMQMADITPTQVGYLVATGVGAECVSFADEQVTEASCCARGATWLFSFTDTVVDIGADKCLVVKCQHGKPFGTARNDRCAAGTGRFLKIAAKPLGIDVEELGQLSLQSCENIQIESVCAVFTESEIISLIHQGCRPEHIARAVFRGLAGRIYSLLLKVGFKESITMIGGIAKNAGMIRAMEEQVRCKLYIPEDPLIVSALGAAIIGAERKTGSFRELHLRPSSR